MSLAVGPSERPLAVVREVAALRSAVTPWRAHGETIGLVPTMGALHAGHMALVERARAECDRVVATLFVNPKQFNQAQDLASYPRDEARDAALFESGGVDLLFAPPVSEIYPEGFSTTVTVSGLTDCLCGIARPGHMAGVATVVTKLLLQSLPDIAYFGEKDYQQLLVIRRLARDLDIPVEIAAVPTVREADGLALSSRNAQLAPQQRALAPLVYRTLCEAGSRILEGVSVIPSLERARKDLLGAGFDKLDYLELRDGETLAELFEAKPGARLFAAAWLGAVRLIDNVPLDSLRA